MMSAIIMLGVSLSTRKDPGGVTWRVWDGVFLWGGSLQFGFFQIMVAWNSYWVIKVRGCS